MLIQRLSHSCEIKDRALSWLESYINRRTESVHLSRKETSPRSVTGGVIGVPQVLAGPSKLCARTQIEKQVHTRKHGVHTQNTLGTNGH